MSDQDPNLVDVVRVDEGRIEIVKSGISRAEAKVWIASQADPSDYKIKEPAAAPLEAA